MKWQPVHGWPQYEVSDAGDLRNAATLAPLKTWASDQGYILARFSKKRAVVRVHRIVAGAFVANPMQKPIVNHIDNNRANNHASNLEWCTQKENLNHARRQGRMYKHPRGKPSSNRKLSSDQVMTAHALRKSGMSLSKIAATIGSNKRTVGRIISGETYVN